MIDITLSKLATLANVSISTVSKAFSGSKEISKETKEMIFKIAKENKCFDKYYKNNYNKLVIGVIIPEFYSRLYGDYLTVLEKEISERNSTMLASCTDFMIKKEKELLEYYTTYIKADGIIIISPKSQKIENYSVPIVSIGGCEHIDSVNYNLYASIYKAIAYFKENGHRKIGFIGENLTKSKENYFYNAMNRLELEINQDYIMISDRRFEYAGYSSMEKLFERGTVPTAILAAYDYIALGIMHSLQSRGMNVPSDISLIGMDDVNESGYLNVPLTTIKGFKHEAVSIALDILYNKIKNPYFTAIQKIEISSELVKRKSVAKAKTPDCKI